MPKPRYKWFGFYEGQKFGDVGATSCSYSGPQGSVVIFFQNSMGVLIVRPLRMNIYWDVPLSAHVPELEEKK